MASMSCRMAPSSVAGSWSPRRGGPTGTLPARSWRSRPRRSGSASAPSSRSLRRCCQVAERRLRLRMYTYTGVNPASPWIRFRDALDDRGVPDYGKTAFWNYNRFKNPMSRPSGCRGWGEVRCRSQDGLRPTRQDLSRECARSAADVPPAELLRVQSSNWENFPTEENPYAPPMWGGAGIQWLFKIKKVGT